MTDPAQHDTASDDPETVLLMRKLQAAIDAGQQAEMESLWDELSIRVGEWASQETGIDRLLQSEASRCIETADWEGAEAAYRRLLDWASRSEREIDRVNAFMRMTHFLRLLGDDRAALDYACLATAAARRDESNVLTAMALRLQVQCALAMDKNTEAEALIEEAIHLSSTTGREMDLFRAEFSIMRADCNLRSNAFEAAETKLAEAWPYLQRFIKSTIAAGGHGVLAAWWMTKTRLDAQRERGDEAVNAWKTALGYLRGIVEMPHACDAFAWDALAVTLRNYGKWLRSIGRASEAVEALIESGTIRAQIGLPPLSEA